jgi:hypothetical protein
VNARPRPREAPVMSHTFDINPLSAVHRKLAADETVNRAILFWCIGAHGICNITLLQVRCGLFDQSGNLLGSGPSRVYSRSYLLSRGEYRDFDGGYWERSWANRPYLTSSVSKANDFQFISPLCAGETAGEVFLFNHFHSPGAVFLSSNEES